MTNETDEFLLSIMSGDNEEARETLYKKYSPQITFLVKNINLTRNKQRKL